MKRRMKNQAAAAIRVYKNPAAPATRRVKDLLSRMTLEEKAAQMMCLWQEKTTKLLDAAGNFDFKKAKAAFKKGHGLGQVGRPSDAGSVPSDAGVGKNARETAELANAIQKFFIEHSRLGIPVMFHEECLHGHAAIGATSFPQPIGLGATFNPDLVEKLFTMTAGEARTRRSPRSWTWRAMRAGAALRRLMAKIRFSTPNSASRRCADFRAMLRSKTRSASLPR